MAKPIYQRAVWKVMKKIARELKLAHEHCPVKTDYDCARHVEAAEAVATKFVLDDMEKAKKCQRNGGNNAKDK